MSGFFKRFSLAGVFVTGFLAAVILSSSTVFFIYWQKETADLVIIENSQKENLTNLQEKFSNTFNNVISDLKILGAHKELEHFLETDNPVNKQKLSEEFVAFSHYRGVYDQIRFLDEEGQEKIRVNYSNGDPQIVSTENLQNKGGRYYFSDTYSLGEDEVFVSPFDLNVESGQIEQPLKPMIRIGMPVFHNGDKRGILLLNYLGQELLDTVDVVNGGNLSQTFLLNRDGYWLKGPKYDSEWGFMFPDRQSENLSKTDPELWRTLTSSQEDMNYLQIKTEGGLYTVVSLSPFSSAQASSLGSMEPHSQSLEDLDPQNYVWWLVSFVPNDQLFSESRSLGVTLVLGNSIFLGLLGAGLWILYVSLQARFLAEERILKLNDILRIITKTLRHDLANAFTKNKLAFEMFADEQKQEYLDGAIEATEQGIYIINQMRGLEKSVIADQPLSMVKVEKISKVASKDCKVAVDISGNANIKADQALEVVFSNLFRNAEVHGKAKNIWVNITKSIGSVTITVEDDGSGIPKDIHDRVFDEGFKYGPTGNTGLGLYISKKTIERYGGTITCGNSPKGGAAFEIIIPL